MCPNDFDSKGKEGGAPEWFPADKQFRNADKDGPVAGAFDPDGNDPENSDDDPKGMDCSYLFEFNGYKCEWVDDDDVPKFDSNGDGLVTWYEAKMVQVNGSAEYTAYGGVVPVVRCFWHCDEPDIDGNDWVNNVQYNYGVDWSPPEWETKHN